MKPTIFIGSSTEGLKTAYAIQEKLEHDDDARYGLKESSCCPATLSKTSSMPRMTPTSRFSWAGYISRIRDRIVSTVRNNVVFELGMFIAALGKQRVLFLVPKGSEKIHLPTDLIGVEPGYYVPPNRDEELLAALGPFCNRVRRQIGKVWREEGSFDPEGRSPSKGNEARSDEPNGEQTGESEKAKNVESGVQVDAFGNYTISIEPTVSSTTEFAVPFPVLEICIGSLTANKH